MHSCYNKIILHIKYIGNRKPKMENTITKRKLQNVNNACKFTKHSTENKRLNNTNHYKMRGCPERVSSSCSTSGSRHVTLVKIQR